MAGQPDDPMIDFIKDNGRDWQFFPEFWTNEVELPVAARRELPLKRIS
jgi:hypothetical protein